MPQATRKDPAAQRAQDKESKRARGALSCAECRRLKLKCDKTVPCSSCKRRGCAEICPNGQLITGQGTRFVLADTEKLHEKINQMSDRIRQLEDALTISHSTTGAKDPHPLLDRDLLKVKSSLELHAAITSDNKTKEEELEDSQYIDAFGTLAIRDDGASTFYGRSAGSESLLIGESASETHNTSNFTSIHRHASSPSNGVLHSIPPTIQEWQHQAGQTNGLPSVLTSLSHSFPLPASHHIPDLDYVVETYLPPWREASRLCDLYLEQAPWFFGAVTKRQLYEEILPMWYAEAPRPVVAPALDPAGTPVGQLDRSTPPIGRSGLGVGTMISSSPPGTHPLPPVDISTASPTSTVQRTGGAHDLALLFMVFCFGALTDVQLPAAPDNEQSEHYYDLTKVGLNLEGILDRPPSVATVQTLSLMGIYEGMRSGENSIESTWALMGMATKLAQSIGLHRDCARWKLPPSEVQKRRALFWELFITDCWQSLATGRLATFSLPFVDCELPFDPDQTMSDDGTPQPSFPFWKARFGAECVSAVVQGTLTSRAPKYSIILELDRKVRDMELPKYSQESIPKGAGLKEVMSYCMPTNYREWTLLYIHRCFFTHAIQSNPSDPIKSPYAPSFLAGYRSACDLLGAVRKQFAMFPAQIARFWVVWTHTFSSTVMISSVVTHGSRSKVAPAALLELNSACDLFEKAAAHGGRAVKFLPIIRRLRDKAQKVFFDTRNGIPPPNLNDIFRPSESSTDEISVFSGKTHTVTTKSARTSVRSPTSNGNGSTRSSQSPGGSPAQSYTTTNPSFAGVHPSLVQELNGFDGHITAQLQNAYNEDHATFNEVLMGQPAVEPHPHLQEQQQQQRYDAEQLVQQQRYELQRQEQEEREREEQERRYMEEQMRQREEEQQRMLAEQEAYAQAQQRQQQEHLQYQYDTRSYESSPTVETSMGVAHGVPAPAPMQDQHMPMQDQRRSLTHSRSHPNLHRSSSYEDYEETEMHSPVRYHYNSQHQHQPPPPVPVTQHAPRHPHPQPHPHHQHQPPPQHPQHQLHSVQASRPPPPQHEMYAVPPEYMPQSHSRGHHQRTHHPMTPDTNGVPSPTSSTRSHHYPSPETVFESQARSDTHSQAPAPYWHHPPPHGVVYEDPHAHRRSSQHYEPGGHHGGGVVPVAPAVHHQQYSPEAAMQGMAAEDPRLQETWQSYMYKVGSPRLMLED